MEYTVAPDCEVMKSFAESMPLRISLIVNFVLSVIAFPILIKSLIYITKTDAFHKNTKLQMILHLIALLIHIIGRLGLHGLDLFNYFTTYDSACDIIPSFYRCLVLRGIHNIGLKIAPMYSIALVLERFASTVLSSSYEHCGPSWGIALVLLQLTLAFFVLLALYFYASFQPGDKIMYYCQTATASSASIYMVVVPLYVILATQILSRVMFYILMKQNQKLRKQLSTSLSNRFNINQGIKSINTITLALNYSTISFIIQSITITTLHLNSYRMPKPLYTAIMEVVNILPIYSIIVPVMIYRNLRKINKVQQKTLVQTIQMDPEVYFQQFKKMIH